MEKPIIPKFVANWVERKKQPDYDYEYETEELNKYHAMGDSIHFTIYSLFANYPETNSVVQVREPILEWLENDRNNYFKLVDAVRYGYEVEKEKLYKVVLGNGYALYKRSNDSPIRFSIDFPPSCLTQLEIESVDSILMKIAEEVTE